MSEHYHPNVIVQKDGMMFKTKQQSQTVETDRNANQYVDIQWPWHYWPCCAGSGTEQTMEIEINGQKIIIKGKDLKIKVEEVE